MGFQYWTYIFKTSKFLPQTTWRPLINIRIHVHKFNNFLILVRAVWESTDTQNQYKQPNKHILNIIKSITMSLPKLLLLIAVFAVAQMTRISKAHNLFQMHATNLNVSKETFPHKVRFAFASNLDYGLYPNGNNIRLQYIREPQHHQEQDKSKWIMMKNSDGSFSFRSYNGLQLRCPNEPKNGDALTLDHPVQIVNQKFSVEVVSSSQLTYRVKCLEKYSQFPAVTSRGYDQDVYLSTKTDSSTVWAFRID